MQSFKSFCATGIFILSLVCVTTKSFSIALTDSIPYDAKLIRGHLDNGLVYYIRPNSMPEHKLELRLVVKAGSVLEDDDQQGLAHFMEHMNFHSTKNFPGKSIVNYLESVGMKNGADINANTGYDRTLYELSVPSDKPENIDKAFLVLEDWAHNALLTDADIEQEKGVILEECRLGHNSAQRMRHQYLPELVCHTKYADREPIGKENIIANVSHDALRRFYHDWYRPDLMAVIVIGDIDTATARRLITEHFSGLSNPAAERPHFFANMPERSSQAAMVVTDNEATSSAWHLYYPFEKYVKGQTVEYYRGLLKQHLLIDILRARLRDLFSNGQQNADISFFSLQECRAFGISTSFPHGAPYNNIKTVMYAIKQPGDYGFFASEMERAKRDVLSNAERTYNEREKKPSNGYIAEYVRNFMDNEPIEGPVNEYLLTKYLLPSITNEEIEQLLHELTHNKSVFTYITGPASSSAHLPDEKTLLNTINACMNQQTAPIKEKVTRSSLLDEEPKEGTIIEKRSEPGLGATTYTLSNGIKITVKPTNYKDDEIRIEGIKNGGKCNYEQEDRINCTFAAEIVSMMGYGHFSPNELNMQLSGKNVSVTAAINSTTDEVSGHCDKRNVATMFQLIYLKLTQCQKNEVVYNTWKENYKKYIDNIYADPETFFRDTVNTVLFNNDARFIGIPDAQDMKKLHMNRALEIYRNEFASADGYHFFIDGNVDTAELIPLITTYLGCLPVSGNPVHCDDNGLRPITGNNKFIVHKGVAKQSHILIKYYGDSVARSEDAVRNMTALTGILNMKVFEHFREQMSDVYTGTFTGEIISKPYCHYEITLSLPCGAEHVDELLAATDAEIKSVREHGPSDEDLQKIKAQLNEKYKVNIQTNAYWLTGMKNVLFSGESVDNFLNYLVFIDKMTKADIQATANLLFDGKNKLTGVLVPE